MAKLRKSSDKRRKRNKTMTKPHAVPREWEDIFHAIGHPSFILGPDHKIIACNKAVANLTGKPVEFFIGKKCCAMLHGKKRPPDDCPMEKLLKSGRFETAEMEVEALGRTFLVSCTPVFDKSGTLARIIHIATDVTGRKRAEEKLRESEERFRIILENLPDGVFVHDLDGRIIHVNRMACTMTGYTKDELTSMKVGDIDKDSITRKDREKIWRKLKKGDSFLLVNATHWRKDKSQYPAEIHINSIVLNKEPAMLALVQDITERKHAEEKLRDNQKQLKALAAELSYAEEHERRRIATGIHDSIGQKLAMAKLKLQFIKDSVPEQITRSAIDSACGMMDEIIDDTRSLVFELSNPILYELGLEQAVGKLLKNEIQNKSGLNCQFVSAGGKIELDEDTKVVLFKAVRELLINILKHAGAKTIKVGISKHDNEVEVAVEDDGIGFDVSMLGLPSGTKGGFGLFNIRERLEYIGGRLEINSHPEKGTRIVMTVPTSNNKHGRERIKLYEGAHSR